MSEPHILECWERGFPTEPPKLVEALLRDDEQLLWAIRLKSIALSRSLLGAGTGLLVFAAVLLVIGPWGQSLEEYCGPDPDRCATAFYLAWPATTLLLSTGLFALWLSWKARYRPWFITYAISTNRAFIINESRPKDFRYVYLRLHPPTLSPTGVLTFEGEKNVFVGLDEQSMTRAAYWATDGRTAFSKDQIGDAS